MPAFLEAMTIVRSWYSSGAYTAGITPPHVVQAKLEVAQVITGYVLCQMMKRLVDEGFVAPERVDELSQLTEHYSRTGMLLTYNGKMSDRELPKRAAAPTPATPSPTLSVQDLIGK